MSNPKRHHFVPESYLNGFVDDDTGFLFVYSKHRKRWLRQKPKKVMVRNKYYHQDWAPEGVDKNILEKTLGSDTEPKGLTSLRKLVKSPDTLSGDDVASILTYIELQRNRVPRQVNMAKSIAKAAISHELRKTSIGRDVLRNNEVVIKDNFRFHVIRQLSGASVPYLSRMAWHVVEAGCGSSFVSTDSPVSYFNWDFRPPVEPGIGLLGTVVIFPLNKRFLLFLRHPEFNGDVTLASEPLPRDLDVEDGVVEVNRGVVWDAEQVLSQNRLMFYLADDLVVGESREVIEEALGHE